MEGVKSKAGMGGLVSRLTLLVLIFSHVIDVEQCSELPICIEKEIFGSLPRILAPMDRQLSPFKIFNHTIFTTILRFSVGTRFQSNDHIDAFLISNFGWSVSLACIGDKNPSEVKSTLIHVRRGVPINNLGERKHKIKDAVGIRIGHCPTNVIEDEGSETYHPRCEFSVANRAEYFSSRNKEFWLSIRLDIQRLNNAKEGVNPPVWDNYMSYRELHNALWNVDVVQDEKCNHMEKSLDVARLGMEVVTFSGLSWHDLDHAPEIMQFPQRVCICLTKDDWGARWLAIKHFHSDPYRRALLRGPGCCEDYALDTVITLPGQWVLIL
jgi:hypothetical protein